MNTASLSPHHHHHRTFELYTSFSSVSGYQLSVWDHEAFDLRIYGYYYPQLTTVLLNTLYIIKYCSQSVCFVAGKKTLRQSKIMKSKSVGK